MLLPCNTDTYKMYITSFLFISDNFQIFKASERILCWWAWAQRHGWIQDLVFLWISCQCWDMGSCMDSSHSWVCKRSKYTRFLKWQKDILQMSINFIVITWKKIVNFILMMRKGSKIWCNHLILVHNLVGYSAKGLESKNQSWLVKMKQSHMKSPWIRSSGVDQVDSRQCVLRIKVWAITSQVSHHVSFINRIQGHQQKKSLKSITEMWYKLCCIWCC